MRQMTEKKNNCRFLVFTDLHYAPSWISWDGDQRLKQIMTRAEEENVDFVMQLGDFLHEPAQNGWLAGDFFAL